MATNQTTLFLPEEHRIISTYLGVEPVENIPDSLTLEVALNNLGLDDEVEIHSSEAYATAAILLERVQDELPQWASVREDQVTLGRNLRDRAAERTVELTPQFLLMINWADSGPGFSWPETYNVTYVPLYDVFVVTGSVDSTDIYGVTDFAIGHFAAGPAALAAENILKESSEAIKGEWNHLASTYGQGRWVYVFGPGLIDVDKAENLADQVWKEDEYEDENEDELPLADGAKPDPDASLTDEESETGSLTPEERLSLVKDASPDSPIFNIGYVIGEKRLTPLSRNTKERNEEN